MWYRWPFRVAISAATTLLALQAVLAGQFLAGTYDALRLHRENATVAGIVVVVAAAAAVPIWRPGHGPLWPAFACLGLFGLIAAQIALGFARLVAVHVPLGIAVIGLALRLTWYAWRAPATEPVDAGPVTPGAEA